MAKLGVFTSGLFATQLFLNFAGSIEPAADLGRAMDTTDMFNYQCITLGSSRWRSGLGCVIGGRGDSAVMYTKHVADRLDPEPGTIGVDELDYHGSRGSSSRAKKDDAANKISLARFNSLTSRSSSLTRVDFTNATPGRVPASISA
jgi:hypothetical protein